MCAHFVQTHKSKYFQPLLSDLLMNVFGFVNWCGGGRKKTHTRCALQVLHESLRRRDMKWRERARVRFCWFLAPATLIIEGETQACCCLSVSFFFFSLSPTFTVWHKHASTHTHAFSPQTGVGGWRATVAASVTSQFGKLSELLTESRCEHAATIPASYTYTGAVYPSACVFISPPSTPGFQSLVRTIFYSLWRVSTSTDLYTSVHQQEIRVMSPAKRWHVYIFNPLRLLFLG